jgi:hypothetical protein
LNTDCRRPRIKFPVQAITSILSPSGGRKLTLGRQRLPTG